MRVLLEAKRDMQFSQSRGASDRAKVVAQAIYYLKAFERSGEPLPQVVVVTDQDEIFYILSKFLTDYLTEKYDWSIAPSSAGEKNFALYQALLNDNNLNVYVETVQRKTFDVAGFIQRVNEGATLGGTVKKVKVDSISLEKAWQEYQHRAFGGIIEDALLQVSIFIKFLLGDKNIYLHPMEKNTIVMEHVDHKGKTQWRKFPMKGSQFFSTMAHEQFFEKYDRADYTWAERKAITESADTLIEEVKRRYHGDYWTPAIWVDEAHRMIEEQLGENWRDEYVVWDPAAGSKNLTRDYRFRELYSSTLHQEELTIAEDYNPEGTAFQYDFLNDDIALHDEAMGLFAKKPSEMSPEEKVAFLDEQRGKWKLPDALIEALVYNKPLVFFMNPPYGSNGNRGVKDNKGSISASAINKMMLQDGIGGNAAQELYAQFIYRCQKIATTFGYSNDYYIFTFAANTYLTSPFFSSFLTKLKSTYEHVGGFMLNAGEFKGTTSSWGINLSGWKLQKDPSVKVPSLRIKYSLVEKDGVEIIDLPSPWYAHVVELSNAISSLIPVAKGNRLPRGTYPTTKNGFATTSGGNRSYFTDQSLGYLLNKSNTLHETEKGVALFTIAYNDGCGAAVEKGNFEEAMVVFSIRRSMFERSKSNLWIKGKDVMPTLSDNFVRSDEWDTFVRNCIVYSLFSTKSNQTSLREYEYGIESDGVTPKKWRVNNEFFWESRDFIQELAIENKIPAIEKDLATDTERYVYSYLRPKHDAGELSTEAEALLSKATEILSASFKYRDAFFEEAPLYNTLSWDMGWVQVQRMCFGRDALSFARADDELQALYEEFKVLRSALGKKIAMHYFKDTRF